jgi:hypothetical protein
MQGFDKRPVSLDRRRDRPGGDGIVFPTGHAANFAIILPVEHDLVANPG